MARATFPKAEHLVNVNDIETLFSTGSRGLTIYPIRAVYRKLQTGEACEFRRVTAPVMVLMSVSKRRFKHAVDRNRAKRLMREAYRLHKQPLVDTANASGTSLAVAFVWLSDEMCSYARVERSIKRLIEIINERV